MMIPILTDYHEPGYLPAPRYGTLPAFFPNVNLAVRRRAAMEIGLYDEACRAGEDADLCLRAALAGWELFYEQRAAVRHEPPPSLAATARRWWWYGFSGGAVFRKAMQHRCEVYFSLEARPRIHRYRRLFAADFSPIRVLVFVSPFLLFHLGALGAAVLLALGWTRATSSAVAPIMSRMGILTASRICSR